MNDYIDQAQETLDWANKNNQVFMIMFIVVSFVLLAVLYIAYRILLKERTESRQERDKFLDTLSMQQKLISDQQKLLEDEKKSLDEMGLNIRSIDNKVGLLLQKEG